MLAINGLMNSSICPYPSQQVADFSQRGGQAHGAGIENPFYLFPGAGQLCLHFCQGRLLVLQIPDLILKHFQPLVELLQALLEQVDGPVFFGMCFGEFLLQDIQFLALQQALGLVRFPGFCKLGFPFCKCILQPVQSRNPFGKGCMQFSQLRFQLRAHGPLGIERLYGFVVFLPELFQFRSTFAKPEVEGLDFGLERQMRSCHFLLQGLDARLPALFDTLPALQVQGKETIRVKCRRAFSIAEIQHYRRKLFGQLLRGRIFFQAKSCKKCAGRVDGIGAVFLRGLLGRNMRWSLQADRGGDPVGKMPHGIRVKYNGARPVPALKSENLPNLLLPLRKGGHWWRALFDRSGDFVFRRAGHQDQLCIRRRSRRSCKFFQAAERYMHFIIRNA